MFELRRLRLLHEFALRGTIAGVASALSYSVSTVSAQLGQLERDAGVTLLEPEGRRLRLTDEGRLLAQHAARALELDEAAAAALLDARGGAARVRIAAMATAAQALVPRALDLLAEREPRLTLHAAELPPETALFELQAHTFDLVVAEQYPGHARPPQPGIERMTLGRDPIRLALPRGDRARSLADLRDRAFVLEPHGTAVREWALQQCRAAGFEPQVRFEATDLTAHIRLVAAGHAVALLPDLVWTGARSTVELLDLPGAPSREIFAATRTSSAGSAAILATRTALADALAEHAPR